MLWLELKRRMNEAGKACGLWTSALYVALISQFCPHSVNTKSLMKCVEETADKVSAVIGENWFQI